MPVIKQSVLLHIVLLSTCGVGDIVDLLADARLHKGRLSRHEGCTVSRPAAGLGSGFGQ
jgi:hypothetical protein